MSDMIDFNNKKDNEDHFITSTVKKEDKFYDLSKASELWELIEEEKDIDFTKEQISNHIYSLQKKYKVEQYELIIIFDEDNTINTFHSNRIYDAISNLNKEKDILMFLLSDGGKIEPAYLISKTCKRLCKDKFVVTIPRRAKSAATLIALGANEIHLGLLSELGPIDPQINGLPALGLTNALEKIAYLSDKFPKSSDMFAKYLTENLKMNELGYFERINESAVQYAQRLLEGKSFSVGETPQSLANHFTNYYKDHSFVIDSEEARRYLGDEIVKEETYEYEFGNELFSFLDFASLMFNLLKNSNFRYVGSVDDGIDIREKRN